MVQGIKHEPNKTYRVRFSPGAVGEFQRWALRAESHVGSWRVVPVSPQLWLLAAFLGDGFLTQTFCHFRNSKGLLVHLKDGGTSSPPAEILLWLITGGSRWVVNYGSDGHSDVWFVLGMETLRILGSVHSMVLFFGG